MGGNTSLDLMCSYVGGATGLSVGSKRKFTLSRILTRFLAWGMGGMEICCDCTSPDLSETEDVVKTTSITWIFCKKRSAMSGLLLLKVFTHGMISE